jgi:hypothetical protein
MKKEMLEKPQLPTTKARANCGLQMHWEFEKGKRRK